MLLISKKSREKIYKKGDSSIQTTTCLLSCTVLTYPNMSGFLCLTYSDSPRPGIFLSSLAIFFARLSIVPGIWQLHMQSLQSRWLRFLHCSENPCSLIKDEKLQPNPYFYLSYMWCSGKYCTWNFQKIHYKVVPQE